MTQINLSKLLSVDYQMIFEALRRLLDGTCCLIDEDKVAALDLFEHIREALTDHIVFEDKVLILISEHADKKMLNYCNQMKEEHIFLSGLLEAAGHELADTHPNAFRSVLIALKTALENHLELEKLISYDGWGSILDSNALLELQKRKKAGFVL